MNTFLNWQEAPRDNGPLGRLCGAALGLPELHAEFAAGKRCPVRAANDLMSKSAAVISAQIVPSDPTLARFAWVAHTFNVAAAEHWGQAAGRKAGETYGLLGADSRAWVSTMMERNSALAPRQREDELWLANSPDDSSPTFTGGVGEHAFRRQVQLVDAETRAIVRVLGPIARRSVRLRDAADALAACTGAAIRLGEGMRDLNKSFLPGAFALDMRQNLLPFPCPFAPLQIQQAPDSPYLAPIDINGTSYPGPNAAYIPGPAALDLLLGIVDKPYSDMIVARRPYYAPADWALIEAILNSPFSLMDALAVELGLSVGDLALVSAAQFADRLQQTDPQTVRGIAELARFGTAYRQWSGAHLGAIRTHVEDATEHIPKHLLATMPVSCDEGVSGNSLDNVKHIAAQRRHGFITGSLQRLLQTATRAEPLPA